MAKKYGGGIKMLDIIFIILILLGFFLLKYFTKWCENQISKKQ
ncbi:MULTISPECIES: hypothetical protein [Clostridium]|nr:MULTISPECIES: hypothetical protein [Clostridium]